MDDRSSPRPPAASPTGTAGYVDGFDPAVKVSISMPQSLRDAVLERVRALGVRSTSAYFRRLALADLAGRQREFPRGGSDEDRARAAEWLRREAGAEAGS